MVMIAMIMLQIHTGVVDTILLIFHQWINAAFVEVASFQSGPKMMVHVQMIFHQLTRMAMIALLMWEIPAGAATMILHHSIQWHNVAPAKDLMAQMAVAAVYAKMTFQQQMTGVMIATIILKIQGGVVATTLQHSIQQPNAVCAEETLRER